TLQGILGGGVGVSGGEIPVANSGNLLLSEAMPPRVKADPICLHHRPVSTRICGFPISQPRLRYLVSPSVNLGRSPTLAHSTTIMLTSRAPGEHLVQCRLP